MDMERQLKGGTFTSVCLIPQMRLRDVILLQQSLILLFMIVVVETDGHSLSLLNSSSIDYAATPFEPLVDIKTLAECAKHCFDRRRGASCALMAYDPHTEKCEILGSLEKVVFTEKYMRSNTFIYAKVDKEKCEKKPDAQVKLLNIDTIIKHKENFPTKDDHMEAAGNRTSFCYATKSDGFCELVEFGTIGEEFRLSKDRKATGYKRVGYCALQKGICKAHTVVTEYNENWPKVGVSGYPNWEGKYLVGAEPVHDSTVPENEIFCHFWDKEQCLSTFEGKETTSLKLFETVTQ